MHPHAPNTFWVYFKPSHLLHPGNSILVLVNNRASFPVAACGIFTLLLFPLFSIKEFCSVSRKSKFIGMGHSYYNGTSKRKHVVEEI
jgi:hypothetical protein